MCSKLKWIISRISKDTKVLFIRMFLFLCYLYVGAFVFMTIEREPAKKQSDQNEIDMGVLKNVTMAEYNMTENQFTKLVDELKPLSCSNLPDWNYEHATSFTLQLLTTIGMLIVSVE